jgi:ATPase subunit of ABC transporter with duplicated ATPase domains
LSQEDAVNRAALLEADALTVDAPGGRTLVRDLCLRLGRERVAVVGRNGAGKSTLLEVLAGRLEATRGRILCRGRRLLVPQQLPVEVASGDRPTASPGERRRVLLQAALDERPDLLLLDEPTSDLDGAGIRWLVQQLAGWRDGLVVVSHDRQLLRTFTRFFIVAESGCRYLQGTFGQLLADLTREREDSERAHRGEMNRLLAREEHNAAVRRRRQRKKNVGRIRELKRCPARIMLNDKRSYKQESQGKRAVLQKERIGGVRDAARASRRALPVALPLELALSRPPEGAATPVVRCDAVTAMAGGRILFRALSLEIARERVAVCGANGSGKTTLLEIALGLRTPAAGQSRCQSSRIGYIAQNADNWRLDESLAELVALQLATGSVETIAAVIRAHRFPLALAHRPLVSLSPGRAPARGADLPHPALAAARAAGAR